MKQKNKVALADVAASGAVVEFGAQNQELKKKKTRVTVMIDEDTYTKLLAEFSKRKASGEIGVSLSSIVCEKINKGG